MAEFGKKIYTKYGWIPEEKPSELEKILFVISDALESSMPHPSLIYAARYVITEHDRALVPDWVAVLAGGNTDLWEDVVDETRRWKAAEEAENASDDDDE